MIEELEARGYDITTLRFSIQKRTPPEAVAPAEIRAES